MSDVFKIDTRFNMQFKHTVVYWMVHTDIWRVPTSPKIDLAYT